jgi:hypothetical protein
MGSQNNTQRKVITPQTDNITTNPTIIQNPFKPPQMSANQQQNSLVPTINSGINSIAPVQVQNQANNTQTNANNSQQQSKGNFFTAFNGNFNSQKQNTITHKSQNQINTNSVNNTLIANTG